MASGLLSGGLLAQGYSGWCGQKRSGGQRKKYLAQQARAAVAEHRARGHGVGGGGTLFAQVSVFAHTLLGR
eukprot:scaffold314557_cov36-Tisochrysis_lutea.AAC.3